MAMAGPCSVPGGAWASPCWLGSSAHWPHHSTPPGHPYKNPDKKMGLCDPRGREETLESAAWAELWVNTRKRWHVSVGRAVPEL